MDVTTLVHRDLSCAAMVGTLRSVRQLVFEESRTSRITLLDTFDGRLHAAGMTLQVVRSGPSDRALVDDLRLQLDQDGSLSATVAVTSVPRLAADLPAGPLGSRVRSVLDVRALMPLLTFETRTVSAVQRDAGSRAVAMVDVNDVMHLGAGAVVPATVTVTGPIGASAKPARKIIELLLANGFTVSKQCLLDLVTTAAAVDRKGVSHSATVPLRPGDGASMGFRAVLLNLLDAMEANWAGTIADIDTEFLHDLRVAVRRTRSILGHAQHVLPDSLREPYRDDFAWLAGATGPARDLDVYALEWPGYVAELSGADTTALQPVLDHILRHRGAAHADLVAVLQTERAAALLSRWRDTLTLVPTEPTIQALAPLAHVVADRFRKVHETVLHRGRQIDAHSPADELHELRKDAKKLRYLVECFAGVMPGKLRRRFVDQLKGLQDNLGAHQDAEVHADELAMVAAELAAEDASAATLTALAALTERLDATRHAARAEFFERFSAYDSAKTDAVVAALVDALQGDA